MAIAITKIPYNARPDPYRIYKLHHTCDHTMDDQIGWPQVRVYVSAPTYVKLFQTAHDNMAQDGSQRKLAYYTSNIVNVALSKHLGE